MSVQSNGEVHDSFNVAIFLYNNVEELDFCGPFEVLKTAADELQQQEQKPKWSVFTVAQSSGLIKTSGNLLVQPHFSFDGHPPIDLLVVPGGAANSQLEQPAVTQWLRRVTRQAQLTASVCTGAFLLGAVDLLDGRQVTTHWSALDQLQARFPLSQVLRDVRWVDEGALVTAAGVSAGIDMSLHLVERLAGRELAEDIARFMEYHWNEQATRIR